MDVSAFSDDNFDVKDWVNKTFKSAEAQENTDAFVSSLVMKLQLYVQQVNSAVEDTSQQVLQSLPRVMRDTELLLQEAVSLQNMMQSVRQEIIKVEQDTGQSMAALERIDSIKMQLQAARQALHEADNWTVLAADLEEVFESGDVESISAKLVSMQQSLRVLAGAPDYEDRRLQLEGLKNRLEAIASPLLVQAFSTGSVEQSRVFVRVFGAIERLPQLLKYYHKCGKGALLQQWALIVDMEQDDSVAEWLSKFYDKLLSHLHEQVRWCGQVFGDAAALQTLVQLCADVLRSLDPSPGACVEAALKQQADPLAFLTDLKQVTKHFAGNLQVAIEAASQGQPLGGESILQLAQAVYALYAPYAGPRYAALEQQRLQQQAPPPALPPAEAADLMGAVQALGLAVPKAVSAGGDASQRCRQFSEGCGYCGLLRALRMFFTGHLEQFRVVLRRLDQHKKEEEDWNLFQICLTFLQNVGELLQQLRRLNSELKRSITDAAAHVRGPPDGSAFSRFRLLLLDEAGRKELDALLKSAADEDEDLLGPVTSAAERVAAGAYRATFQAVLSPVTAQLERAAAAPAWAGTGAAAPGAGADLPDFSFAPQEYITQIGQYLMTLPQHLEPFLLQDNPALALALEAASAQSECDVEPGGFADVLLGSVARSACAVYCDCILGTGELGPAGCKQLATDIDYLGNVLEDLGLPLAAPLQQLGQLLRLRPADYHSRSAGCEPRLVAAVRQMRNLTSSS